MQKLLEQLAASNLVYPQDIGTGDVTSAWIDIADAERFFVIAKAGAVTAAKTLTLTPLQDDVGDGTHSKALGAPVVVAGAGGNPPAAIVKEFLASDLDINAGFRYVAFTVRVNEAGKLGGLDLVLGARRNIP